MIRPLEKYDEMANESPHWRAGSGTLQAMASKPVGIASAWRAAITSCHSVFTSAIAGAAKAQEQRCCKSPIFASILPDVANLGNAGAATFRVI